MPKCSLNKERLSAAASKPTDDLDYLFVDSDTPATVLERRFVWIASLLLAGPLGLFSSLGAAMITVNPPFHETKTHSEPECKRARRSTCCNQ